MICCFLGHSHIDRKIDEVLEKEILRLYFKYPSIKFYVGTHGSFDNLVKTTLRRLKKQYSDLNYNIVLAYMPLNRGEYYDETEYADTIYPDGLENVPKRFAIIKRNEWMIKSSDIVICYLESKFSKTYDFVSLAEKKGKKIINLFEI